ncbi:capsid protein [Botryosphaeria dothidea RNA virus 1]|uniref:Capsid protein n=1 Tax=Botryosphaeria dothidea RNA virus 1 TaxID=2849745 RepID=A0A0F6TMZ8_9VIRU|nr:hypothetical protein [Botryosphaeria dothidea RNA virus 1]AKE49498.1 hypothetical protein [Botryosphaeria dothidea RNA virus 1]ALZ41797.1 capsid protein [Botryosphaeria dothidea RNA virus 1]
MASTTTTNNGPLLLTKEQASLLAALGEGEVAAIIKLASLGLRPTGILEYARAVDGDEVPAPPTPNTAAKPVTIVAWSFLKDRGQYHATYGLSAPRAGELLELLLTDADAAAREIHTIVADALRQRGSPRPVHVTLDGVPSRKKAGGEGAPTGDGGLGLLSQEIASNPGTYGSYRFVPEQTGQPGARAYRVRLGGGLYVFAQSKKLATAAARITRVKGRSDPLVRDFVAFWATGSSAKFGGEIPDKVTFDGRQGPNEPLQSDPTTKAKTTAGPSSE